MRISIAERFRPFSHLPGDSCLLPLSTLSLQIFPTRIRLFDLAKDTPLGDLIFTLCGPVADFTIIQDLEKGVIRVFGHSPTGYFRYICKAEASEVFLKIEKGDLPVESMPSCVKLETVAEPQGSATVPETLSLGSHKSQDWELMWRRKQLEEILPLWLRLGQMIPRQTSTSQEGTLFERCRECIEKKEKEKIVPAFLDLFQAGFSGMLVPRLKDEQYQGFSLPPFNAVPLALLTEGTLLIRSLFIQESERKLAILPALPPQFHCGRLVGLQCGFGGIDLEWTKKTIRRLILNATTDGPLHIDFQKQVKKFRLRIKKTQQWIECGAPIQLEKGQSYFFDNFQS